MDRYKAFDEIQEKISSLFDDFELTREEQEICLDMIIALSNMWSRQILLHKTEYESIM